MIDERRYRDLLDLVTQGVIETTPDGAILMVNAAFARILGYESPQELCASVGRAGDLYANSGERPQQVQRAGHGTADGSHAIEVRRKDGGRMWVHAHVIPTLDPDGQLIRMTAVLDEIEDHQLTQRALDDAVQRIEARERTLLAEAVHDEPLQLIAAALLRLDSLQRQVPEPAAGTLEQVVTLLDQSAQQLRRLIVSLRPPDLGDGLGRALLDLAEGLFIEGRTTVELRGPVHVPLSTATKTVAYLVLREALFNVRKHAQAQHVLIEVEVQPEEVFLSVTDDGVGAESLVTRPGHMGVTTMHARAQSIGTDLDITSRAGAGTKVTLRAPRPTER